MHITSKNKQGNTENITIVLKQEDYKTRIEESLKKYSKSVKISGFRPGKVPVAHLKHAYGSSILFEEINKVFNEALNKYIQENSIEIVGEPLLVNADSLKNLSIDNLKEIDCEFEIGIAPAMDVDFTNIEFIKYSIVPTEEDVDKEIELLQKAFADRKDLDKSDAQSFLSVQIEKISTDTDKANNTINRLVDIKAIKSETIKSIFLGLHTGNTFNIALSNLDSKEKKELQDNILKIEPNNDLLYKSDSLKIKVNKIWQEKIADLNENLFKKIFPTDTPKKIEEFKERVKQGIYNRNNEYANINLAGKIINHIESRLQKKDLPEEFLKKWLKQINNTSETYTEEGFKKFLNNFRWALFEKKIQKQQNIEISKEDITQAAILHITGVAKSHGYNLSKEQLQTHIKEILKDKNSLQSLYQNTLSAKVYHYICGIVTIKNEEISFLKFDELSKNIPISDLAYKIAKEALIRGYLTN